MTIKRTTGQYIDTLKTNMAKFNVSLDVRLKEIDETRKF